MGNVSEFAFSRKNLEVGVPCFFVIVWRGLKTTEQRPLLDRAGYPWAFWKRFGQYAVLGYYTSSERCHRARNGWPCSVLLNVSEVWMHTNSGIVITWVWYSNTKCSVLLKRYSVRDWGWGFQALCHLNIIMILEEWYFVGITNSGMSLGDCGDEPYNSVMEIMCPARSMRTQLKTEHLTEQCSV